MVTELEKAKKHLAELQATILAVETSLEINREKYDGKVYGSLRTNSRHGMTLLRHSEFKMTSESSWHCRVEQIIIAPPLREKGKLHRGGIIKHEMTGADSQSSYHWRDLGTMVPRSEALFERLILLIGESAKGILGSVDLETGEGFEALDISVPERDVPTIDIPHLVLTDSEKYLVGDSPFLMNNVLFLSPQSLKLLQSRLAKEQREFERVLPLTTGIDASYVRNKRAWFRAFEELIARVRQEKTVM